MNALLWRYASLRLPLAILELPLYVLLPKLYSELLPIGIVGLMLLAARALDALADPWLGRRWDVQSVLSAQALSKRAWYSLSMASTVFVLGFLCLLWWPMFAKAWALEGLWSGLVLGIASILTYLRREWGHTATPVDPAQVAAIRKATAGHSDAFSPEELNLIK